MLDRRNVKITYKLQLDVKARCIKDIFIFCTTLSNLLDSKWPFILSFIEALYFFFIFIFSGEYLQNQISHSTLTISLDVHRTGSSFFFGLPHLMKLIDLSDGSNDRIISLRLTKRYHQKINQKIYALQKYVSFRMKVVQSLSLMQSDTSNIDIILNIILVTVQS